MKFKNILERIRKEIPTPNQISKMLILLGFWGLAFISMDIINGNPTKKYDPLWSIVIAFLVIGTLVNFISKKIPLNKLFSKKYTYRIMATLVEVLMAFYLLSWLTLKDYSDPFIGIKLTLSFVAMFFLAQYLREESDKRES